VNRKDNAEAEVAEPRRMTY